MITGDFYIAVHLLLYLLHCGIWCPSIFNARIDEHYVYCTVIISTLLHVFT